MLYGFIGFVGVLEGFSTGLARLIKLAHKGLPEHNVGALIIIIGFGGPLHYKYDNKDPQNSMDYLGPYINSFTGTINSDHAFCSTHS